MEFIEWPPTPRLFRTCVITEKIDGTNAAVVIEPVDNYDEPQDTWVFSVVVDGIPYAVGAQSRKRLITPQNDNHGFAQWVKANALALAKTLGEGRHYGEWWGSGIQRGYGLKNGDKRFSLFNTYRWEDVDLSSVPGLGVVPWLYKGPFSTLAVREELIRLEDDGSAAVPGWMQPEGVMVYHTASRSIFKATILNDETPKGDN